MKNDIIYCLHCKKVFRDTMRKYKYYKVQDTKLEDSRFNTNYKNMCPFCLSCNTTNVGKILLFGDNMTQPGKDSYGNWSLRSFYFEIKEMMKKQNYI